MYLSVYLCYTIVENFRTQNNKIRIKMSTSRPNCHALGKMVVMGQKIALFERR